MTSLYETFIKNLTLYMNKLPLSRVKFLYFNASDLQQSKMRDTFREFAVDSTKCYIIGGKDENYFYIYNESIIKYLVNIKLKNGLVYDVDILNSGTQYDVNHGDHIDFGVIKTKANDIIVKTHKTLYIDLGNFVFDRSSPECNFIFDPTKLINKKQFDTTKCVRVDNSICGDIINVYSALDRHIILHICQEMSAHTQIGGSKKKQYGGGSLHEKPFWDHFINALTNLRNDVLEIRVIDDKSEKNNNIVILIDFEDYTRSIVLIPKNNIPTQEEITKELNKLYIQR